MESVSFTFVPREFNMFAHTIAKYSLRNANSELCELFDFVPRCLSGRSV